jgi:four helix bundle protein
VPSRARRSQGQPGRAGTRQPHRATSDCPVTRVHILACRARSAFPLRKRLVPRRCAGAVCAALTSMAGGSLRVRTRALSLGVLRLLDSLPTTPSARVIQAQLGRSATSVGANYRRACLAQSRKDFIAKLKTVEEEVDESEFWLDMLLELGIGNATEAARLRAESQEIRAMTVASIKTSRLGAGDR